MAPSRPGENGKLQGEWRAGPESSVEHVSWVLAPQPETRAWKGKNPELPTVAIIIKTTDLARPIGEVVRGRQADGQSAPAVKGLNLPGQAEESDVVIDAVKVGVDQDAVVFIGKMGKTKKSSFPPGS